MALRGMDEHLDVVYRTDVETFDDVVHLRLSPQQAFFLRRIEIEGNLEKGLKLAGLLGQFLADNLPERDDCKEAAHDLIGPA